MEEEGRGRERWNRGFGLPLNSNRLPEYSGRSSVRQPRLPWFHSSRTPDGNSSPTCRGRGLLADYVKNVFEEGELDRNSVVANFATTAEDGKKY